MAARLVTSANKITLRDVVPGAQEESTLTLSGGAIVPTRGSHIVAAESGTADDCDTITLTNLRAGDVIELTPDTGDTITFTSGVGNITTDTGASIVATAGQTVRCKVNAAGDGVLASLISGKAYTEAYVSKVPNIPASTELTIASGAVTLTGPAHTIDTESDAASDDLTSVTFWSGAPEGATSQLRLASASRAVVFKHNDSTGGLVVQGAADFTLEDKAQIVTLTKTGDRVTVSYGGERAPVRYVFESGDLQTALTEAGASGQIVELDPSITYSFTNFSIPNGVRLITHGALLADNGTHNNASVAVIEVGENCTVDTLNLSMNGGDTSQSAIRLATGSWIDRISLVSATQRGGEGVYTEGQDVHIGFLYTNLIDRPLNVLKPTGEPSTGFWLGGSELVSYLRGLRFANQDRFYCGPYKMHTLSPNAIGHSPGENGILAEGISRCRFDAGTIEDSGEHAFRIGGSNNGNNSTFDVSIGVLNVIASGNCALKINPTVEVSVGVTETANNIYVEAVHGVDVGQLDTGSGNRELLRITHVRGLKIGSATARIKDYTYSCQYGLQINDAQDVLIGELLVESPVGSLVYMLETSDVDEIDYFGSHVLNLRISRAIGSNMGGSNAIAASMPNFNIGDIYIEGLDLDVVDTTLLTIAASAVTSNVHIQGAVKGATPPAYSGPVSNLITYDITYGGGRFIGHPTGIRTPANGVGVMMDALDIGNVSPNGVFAMAPNATVGDGNWGPVVTLSRVGSSRRGGALATQQTSSENRFTSLWLLFSTSTTASDQLFPGWGVYHDGDFLPYLDDSYSIGNTARRPDYVRTYRSALKALAADPSDPPSGESVMWMSDGTGAGDAGDIMMKINVGGTTKTITLVDYSAF